MKKTNRWSVTHCFPREEYILYKIYSQGAAAWLNEKLHHYCATAGFGLDGLKKEVQQSLIQSTTKA